MMLERFFGNEPDIVMADRFSHVLEKLPRGPRLYIVMLERLVREHPSILIQTFDAKTWTLMDRIQVVEKIYIVQTTRTNNLSQKKFHLSKYEEYQTAALNSDFTCLQSSQNILYRCKDAAITAHFQLRETLRSSKTEEEFIQTYSNLRNAYMPAKVVGKL
jgi:hypothetical protein